MYLSRVGGPLLALVLCSTLSGTAVAATASPASPAASDAFVFWLGSFDPQDSHPAPRGNGFALGLGYERRHAHLRYGGEVSLAFADYRTPDSIYSDPFTVISDTMTLTSAGLAGTVALGQAVGAFEVYGGVGAGLYLSTMRLHGSTLGFPGSHDERDSGFGFSIFAGMSLQTGTQTRLGIELRRLELDADFGLLSSGNMPIGGNFVLLTYRRLLAATP